MAFLVRAPASRTGNPGFETRSDELWQCGPGRGGYIGAVTWMGVRFRGVSVTDVAMPVRAVCKTSLSSKRGASRTGIPGSRPAPTSCGSVDPGGYIYTEVVCHKLQMNLQNPWFMLQLG